MDFNCYVNSEVKLDASMVENLKVEPFYNFFEWSSEKLVPWAEFINHKSFMVVYFIKVFMRKFACRQRGKKVKYTQI